MKLLLSLFVVLVSFQAVADDYVMPASPPMTQEEIQNLISSLTKFVPSGKNAYQGVNGSSASICTVSFYLDTILPDVGFQFAGINLGLAVGSSLGDNVNYILVKNAIQNNSDGTQTLDLAIVNQGGFGDNRMGAYIIKSRNGSPLNYQTGAAARQAAFQPGETITPSFDTLACNNLVRK